MHGRFVMKVSLAAGALVLANVACSLLFPFDDLKSSGDGGNGPSDGGLDAIGEGGLADAETSVPIREPRDASYRAPCEGPKKGSVMVDAGGFCIDAYEATRTDYATFLAQADPKVLASDPECSFKSSFAQNPACVGLGGPDAAVGGVDWCDAKYFCEWAGKRICGELRGGPLGGRAARDEMNSAQWFTACTGSDTGKFPYGKNFDAGACVSKAPGGPADGAVPFDVGSTASCVGGYPGIFDMSGNISEWEDSCLPGATVATDKCSIRGGDFTSGIAESLACSYYDGIGDIPRAERRCQFGIRCCAD